jgi:hypothetical protein
MKAVKEFRVLFVCLSLFTVHSRLRRFAMPAVLISALRTLPVRHLRCPLVVCCLAAWLSVPLSAFAQGPLTPPGMPTPTMKSLDQIEARTPISSLPFTISSSGSYYLTKNLSVSGGDGITISADKVTLDLNGFTISSTAGSANGSGVLLSGTRTNVTIVNGFITGSVTQSGGSYSGGGFQNGITFSAEPSNVRVSGITVSGCLVGGIVLHFNSTVVQNCVVNTVGSYGIYAQAVSDSVASNCGFDGLQVQTAQNCLGSSTGGGTGVYANLGAVNCAGVSVSNDGLYALNATNCYGATTSGMHGLNAFSANNCYGYHGGSGIGLNTFNAQSCYGQSNSGTGLNANNAFGSYGTSSSGSGLIATTATGCSGVSNSGSGLAAEVVLNCYGESTSGTGAGIVGFRIVAYSYGVSTAPNYGISATILIGSQWIGSVQAAHTYLTGIGPDS